MENARLGDAGSLLELAAPVAVVGFGLCWAALYIIDYTFIFMPVDTFSTVQRDVGRVCYLAGIFLCEAAVFLLYGRLSAFNFRLPLAFAAYGLLVVMVAVNALQDVMGLSVWACAASMLAAGMWQGVFHILWAEAFMHFDGKVRRNLYLAVITGAIGFVVATLIAGTALSGMLMVLLLAFLSLLCYLFVHRFLPDGDAPVKSLSKQSAKKLSRSNVVLFCFGMVFGVAIYACMEPDLPVYVSYPLTGLGLGIGVALLLAVDLRSKKTVAFNDLVRLLLPLVAVVLMVITFAPDLLKWVSYLALLALLTAFDVAVFCFLFDLTGRLRLAPVKGIARGRLFLQCGMVVAGVVSLLLADFFDLSRDYSFVMPLLMMVLLFVVVAVSGQVNVLPRQLEEPSGRKDEAGGPEREAAVKCWMLAEQHGLSRREVDVLDLLLKGYDTNSVAEKLFLSPYTVKSHTYHIYKKLGIGSRQELLRMRDEL